MHPIIEKIIKDGPQSVNLSALSKDLRMKLMTDAGKTLMHQNRYKEAGQAFAIGENTEMLKEQGRWFLQQNNFGLAAYFLLHVERDEGKLEELAQQCITSNNYDAAKAIYEKLGNQAMLLFLQENL
jgi:hypothetical protein